MPRVELTTSNFQDYKLVKGSRGKELLIRIYQRTSPMTLAPGVTMDRPVVLPPETRVELELSNDGCVQVFNLLINCNTLEDCSVVMAQIVLNRLKKHMPTRANLIQPHYAALQQTVNSNSAVWPKAIIEKKAILAWIQSSVAPGVLKEAERDEMQAVLIANELEALVKKLRNLHK